MRIPMKRIIPPRDPEVIRALTSPSREVLWMGPRECSKSFLSICKGLAKHEAYPGFTSIYLRRYSVDIGAILIQLDKKILRHTLVSDLNPFVFKSSSKKIPGRHIEFDNGGIMAFAGMDNPEKMLSFEWDFAVYNQADSEDDMDRISNLLGSMGGRAGNWVENGVNRSQLICDANPTHKRHILLQRVENGSMERYNFTHKSHPDFYDWDVMDYTKKGTQKIKDLEDIYPPGYMRDRMVYGMCNSPEGAVFPMFDEAKHVKEMQRGDFDNSCKWYYAADWGTINTVGIYVKDTNGKHYMFKEIYTQGESVEETLIKLREVTELYKIRRFEMGYVDHEIDNRKQVAKFGFPVRIAEKGKAAGIENIKWALNNELIYFNRNSLHPGPDPQLRGTLHCVVQELPAAHYLSDKKKNGTKADDLPDKDCIDHGTDQLEYYCTGNVIRNRKLPNVYLGAVKKRAA